MKYRSTIKTITTSLLILLTIAIISVFLTIFLIKPNFDKFLQKQVDAAFDLVKPYKIEFDNISSSILTNAKISKVKIYDNDKKIADIKEVRIVGIFSLLKSYLFNNDRILNLVIDNLDINSKIEPFLDLLSKEESQDDEVKNNTNFIKTKIKIINSDLNLTYKDKNIKVKDINSNILLNENLSIENLNTSIDTLSLNDENAQLKLVDLNINSYNKNYSIDGQIYSGNFKKDNLDIKLNSKVKVKINLSQKIQAFLDDINFEVIASNEKFNIYIKQIEALKEEDDYKLSLNNLDVYSKIINLDADKLNFDLNNSLEGSLTTSNLVVSLYDKVNIALDNNKTSLRINNSILNFDSNIDAKGIIKDFYLSKFIGNIDVKSQINISDIFSSIIEINSSEISFDKIFSSYNLNLKYENDKLKVNLNDYDKSQIDIHADTKKQNLIFDFNSQGARLSNYKNLFKEILPFTFPHIKENTLFNSKTHLEYSFLEDKGEVDLFLNISDAMVGERKFNSSFNLKGSLDKKEIQIDDLGFSLNEYLIKYTGSLTLDKYLPTGVLEVLNEKDEEEYAKIVFWLTSDNSYSFILMSRLLENTRLAIDLDWKKDKFFQGVGNLYSNNIIYPVSLNLDLNNKSFNLKGDNLNLDVNLAKENNFINLIFNSNRSKLPNFKFRNKNVGGNAEITVDLRAIYDIENKKLFVNANDFSITNIILDDNLISFDSQFVITEESLQINKLKFNYNNYDELNLNLDVKFKEKSAKLKIYDANKEFLKMAIYPLENDIFSIFIEGNDFDLNRVGYNSNFLVNHFAIHAKSNFKDILEANIHLFLDDIETKKRMLESEIYLNQDLLKLIDFNYSSKFESVEFDNSIYNFKDQKGHLDIHYENQFLKLQTTSDLSIDLFYKDYSSSIEFIKSIILGNFNLEKLRANIEVKNTKYLDTLFMKDDTFNFNYKDETFYLKGNSLDLNFNKQTKNIYLKSNDNFLLPLDLQGIFDPNALDLKLKDFKFPLRFFNTLFYDDDVYFNDGYISGDIRILGDFEKPSFYGSVSAKLLNMRVFWVPGYDLITNNLVGTIIDDQLRLARSKVHAIDREEGGIIQASVGATLSLDEWPSVKYVLDIRIPEGKGVRVEVPVLSAGVNILGKAYGQLFVSGDNAVTTLSGDLDVYDTTIYASIVKKYALHRYDPYEPVDYYSGARFDLNFITHQNVNVVYPNDDNPVIRAQIADNQRFKFFSDFITEEIYFDGDIKIRGGEILYVQKNFIIKEGSILNRTFGKKKSFDPVFNLKAKLSELDENNQRIDIYLILNNSTLNSLSPYFESIPYKSNNDILKILGMNLIDAGSRNNANLSSVFVAATDILSQIGFVNLDSKSSLTNIIKETFALDIFSIRSSFLSNIVSDVFATNSSINPLARYLHNTTIYLGKYLLDNLFLEMFINLHTKDDDNPSTIFFTNNLKVDLELSLDWETPMATFTLFSTPKELSISSFFNNIGFSISKSFSF